MYQERKHPMFKNSPAFSGFSVNDLDAAKAFYADTLGLDVVEEPAGLGLKFANGGQVFLYPKEDHAPATFTVLNFPVDDIDAAVDELTRKGMRFERYGVEMGQDEKGIFRGASQNAGPDIAWFTDPAGNILAVMGGVAGS
jgi:catechol 2,3-dioxygenase-like lactoylglutathione lyase family enzyme